MEKSDVFKNYDVTSSWLGGKGVLLLTGEGNPMTIGWGQLGVVWGRPVFTVMVRPSRFSYQAISETGEFSVNVLPKEMGSVLGVCGSKSGRDTDKIALCNLTLEKSDFLSVPHLAQSEIVYECKTLYKDDMLAKVIPADLEEKLYPAGDYHTFFIAEILNVIHRI